MSKGKCPFCNSECESNSYNFPNSNLLLIFVSCEVCGKFNVDTRLNDELIKLHCSSPQKINCVMENIQEQSNNKKCWSWLSKNHGIDTQLLQSIGPYKYFEDYSTNSIIHSEKTNNILKRLAEKAYKFGPQGSVGLSLKDCFILGIAGFDECKLWIESLLKNDLIISTPTPATQLENIKSRAKDIEKFTYSLTTEGWREVEKLFKNIQTKKAFVAMSFNLKDRSSVERAIKLACKSTGWDAFTIQDANFNGDITDEIIYSINKSGLVIADFTENNRGVYYEAGYADGRGLPVIYTVKDDSIDGKEEGKQLHFDTRNFNHIVWKDPSDLEIKLAHKIGAVVNR